MKQNDWATVIIVIAISLTISFLVGNAFINTDANRSEDVEKVVPVSAEFPAPDSSIFGNNSINPTELIEIGDTNNQQPFGNNN